MLVPATKSDEEYAVNNFSVHSPGLDSEHFDLPDARGARVWGRGGEGNDNDYCTYRTINMGDLVTIIREIEWLSGHAALFNGALEFARPSRHYTSNKCETVFNPRPRSASGLSRKKITCFAVMLLRTRTYEREVLLIGASANNRIYSVERLFCDLKIGIFNEGDIIRENASEK